MPAFADFFQNQAEASAHVQFVYDLAAGHVVFINAAYEQVFQGIRELVNAELPDLLQRLHPDDQAYLAHYWARWVQGPPANEVEVRLLHEGQPHQWFCLTPSYWQDAQGRVLLGGTLRDISVMKRYQENADLFNSRKNATLEILSHDLSGAFIMVQQIAQFLREEVTSPLNSRVPEMLGVLETTSRDSVTMIRELINLEFLTSANTDLKVNRVDVGAVLRVPLDQLQTGQRLLGHVFSYTLPAEPVYANIDVNKFTQVLINLVSNAFKFTPDAGFVAVRIESGPGVVRIYIEDDGIGIPLAMQPYLFERFTKARRPGLRGEATTGLGLALCKTIVEWHYGHIFVTSQEGQGSTFTIEIPRAETVDTPARAGAVEMLG
ncbi:PAS domain-containing sensor histidine kinase [Hymenobacter elongatus]|uniref:histidine kinase n=1 Tax=Hymenobacter elongatus TaxID=877208 RepID=A0A4Z0PN99_9BACT|nr:PAS domain-containing sensor histidine kinase [Hymenobacter elongatus]TGE17396.1 PAS domain-containing sensor histidine kinase [Hymenobacter elongatus]